MQYIDIIIIILLLWSVYQGYQKGFIYMAASLIALVLGIWGAIHFSTYTGEFISDRFTVSQANINIIAFTVTFFVIVIAVRLLAKVVEGLMKAVALGFVNRLAGVLFSVLRMVFIASILCNMTSWMSTKTDLINEEELKQSITYSPIKKIAPIFFRKIDMTKIDGLKDKINEQTEIIENKIEA